MLVLGLLLVMGASATVWGQAADFADYQAAVASFNAGRIDQAITQASALPGKYPSLSPSMRIAVCNLLGGCYQAKGQTAQAYAQYDEARGNPSIIALTYQDIVYREFALAEKVNDATKAKAVMVEWFKWKDDPTWWSEISGRQDLFDSGDFAMIETFLPPKDAANVAIFKAQLTVDRYSAKVKAAGNSQANAQITTLVNQLTKGGSARPLSVTQEAQDIATAMAGGTGAACPYLIALFNGDYDGAIRYAQTKVVAAKNPTTLMAWNLAISKALACKEQNYNGTALLYLKWCNDNVGTNPIAGIIGQ
jgi:hypothetical protein